MEATPMATVMVPCVKRLKAKLRELGVEEQP